MLLFESREIREAKAHAAKGGQALHIFNEDGSFDRLTKISVFLTNHPWAHLFDRDRDRLIATAKKLGVRVIVVGRDGEEGQHIDLCAGPLKKAARMCENYDERFG